jgi:hypothetical protein
VCRCGRGQLDLAGSRERSRHVQARQAHALPTGRKHAPSITVPLERTTRTA